MPLHTGRVIPRPVCFFGLLEDPGDDVRQEVLQCLPSAQTARESTVRFIQHNSG